MNKETKIAIKDFFMEYVPYIIIIIFVILIRTFVATPIKVNGSSMNNTLKDGDVMLLYKLTKKFKGINRFDIVVIDYDDGTLKDKLIKRVIGLPGESIKYEITESGNDIVSTLYIDGVKVDEYFIDDDTKIQTCKYETPMCSGVFTIPEGEYYVMGDNRGNSKDSRIIGTIKESDIMGTTELIMFPFSRIGKVD